MSHEVLDFVDDIRDPAKRTIRARGSVPSDVEFLNRGSLERNHKPAPCAFFLLHRPTAAVL
jgi:hypothetical protein